MPREETGDAHLLLQHLDQGFGSHLHRLGVFLKLVLEVVQEAEFTKVGILSLVFMVEQSLAVLWTR